MLGPLKMEEAYDNAYVFAFCGRTGSGKNYAANELAKRLFDSKPFSGLPFATTIVPLSFAEQLKLEAIVKDNLPRETVFGKKDQRSRQALQTRGMEGRNLYGENYWIRFLEEKLISLYRLGIRYFLITDLRFDNELSFIRKFKNSHVFKVVSPTRSYVSVLATIVEYPDEEKLRHIDEKMKSKAYSICDLLKMEDDQLKQLTSLDDWLAFLYKSGKEYRSKIREKVNSIRNHPSETHSIDFTSNFLINNDYEDKFPYSELSAYIKEFFKLEK